jgi:hypothetical protein
MKGVAIVATRGAFGEGESAGEIPSARSLRVTLTDGTVVERWSVRRPLLVAPSPSTRDTAVLAWPSAPTPAQFDA